MKERIILWLDIDVVACIALGLMADFGVIDIYLIMYFLEASSKLQIFLPAQIKLLMRK